AAAARELLGTLEADGMGEDSASLAPLLLRARAEADGLLGEPPADWFDPLASRRALAILRHPIQPAAGDERDAWRRLSAAADPDPRVRRLASLVPALPPLPEPAPWLARLLEEPDPPPQDPLPAWSTAPGVDRLGRALASGLAAAPPAAALARLAALHELARS